MKLEKYQPTQEEIKKAEDMMSPEEKALSEYRENLLESRKEKGFTPIDSEILNLDLELQSFLSDARISKSKRGDGVFVSGIRGADTSKFRKYGIPVQGALIIPTKNNPESEIEILTAVIESFKKSSTEKKRLEETEDKKKNQEIADKEFEKRMEALQPHIHEFEKVADEYKNSLGAHIIAEKDGSIKLMAGKFEFSVMPVAIDYELPQDIRNLRYMPKPEWAHKKPEEVRAILDKEINIASNRERLMPEVNKLQDKLKREVGKIYKEIPTDYRGKVDQNVISGLSDTSHNIEFRGQNFEWSDQGFKDLEQAVQNTISEAESEDKNAWAELKTMDVNGLPVTHDLLNELSLLLLDRHNYSIDNGAGLMIGEKFILFGKEHSAKEAYDWAIENGAINYKEYKIRKAINEGENIYQTTVGHGTSPDHMRTIDFHSNRIDNMEIGKPGDHYYDFALSLVKERSEKTKEKLEKERSLEMEKMKVRIVVGVVNSNTKSDKIVAEGLFTDAINEAMRKIKIHEEPRRGYNIEFTRLLEDQKEGRTKQSGFLDKAKSPDIIKYLKEFNKEDLL